MSPLEYYREQCDQGVISQDPQQLIAIQHLQMVYSALLKEYQYRNRIFSFMRKPKSVSGLYVWGGVGIGKTHLMDIFYHCLPFPNKMRLHFHQFMQLIHKKLKEYQGEPDPLKIVANELAKKTLVLCFDEFFVNDIADAMILARLFKALFANGVSLVCTSNVPPDDLYKNGLQRKLFLPAIEMLKHHTTVLHVPTTIDYRLRHLKEAGVFYSLQDADAQQKMEKTFHLLAHGEAQEGGEIDICDRQIPFKKQADNIIWFDFNVICHVPRSQHDYLALAEKYHTVFISNIPYIEPEAKNTINLFIRLVDVFYDAKVRLVFSAMDKVENLYPEGPLKFEYARTCSRLLEMQSESYFSIEKT